MRTLVLCVDRDNDLHQKAGVKTPVIGREENLNAAVMFACKDPEDADVNSMFAAIEMYDELKKVDPSVEVATIAGSPNVGYHSDRILASQLEKVLEQVKPEEVILVSDGAEDEAVYPIISSRVRISSVRQVMVKQAPRVEGTFYAVKSALREKHFLTPVALIILMLSVFSIAPLVAPVLGWTGDLSSLPSIGLGLTGLVVAVYMISFTYQIPRRVSEWVDGVENSLRTAKFRFSTNIIGLVILGVGIFLSYTAAVQIPGGPWPMLISFFAWMVVVTVLIAGVLAGGRIVDSYVATGRWRYSYFAMVLSVGLIGVVVYAALELFRTVLQTGGALGPLDVLLRLWVHIAVAIIIAGMGVAVGRQVRRMEKKAALRKAAQTPAGSAGGTLQADGGQRIEIVRKA